MKRRFVIVAVLLACLTGAFYFFGRSTVGNLAPVVGPSLSCPATADLGECNFGERKSVTVLIRNNGSEQLVLDGFRMSCTCSSIVELTPTGHRPLTALSIRPHDAARIAITVNVRSRYPSEAGSRISFVTNDPRSPEWAIDVRASRVRGGLTALPDVCNFGTIDLGSDQERYIHLYDEAVSPRKITSVESSDPTKFQVSFDPIAGDTKTEPQSHRGHYLGVIRVRLIGTRAGSLDGVLHIVSSDGETTELSVPLVGRVVDKLSIVPNRVILNPVGDGTELEATAWLRLHPEFTNLSVTAPLGTSVRLLASPKAASLVPIRISVSRASILAQSGRIQLEVSSTVNGAVASAILTIELP